MAEAELLTEIAGPLARITFNRPHVRNALTAGMVSAMREFLKTMSFTEKRKPGFQGR